MQGRHSTGSRIRAPMLGQASLIRTHAFGERLRSVRFGWSIPMPMSKENPTLAEKQIRPLPDGGAVAVYTFVPPGREVRGTIVVTHGMGEHAGRYVHVAERFARAGLRVFTWDLRGHGRSSGRRGDVRGYEVLTDDLHHVWELAAASNAPNAPLFLHGHSTGGQIALNFAVKHRPAAEGLIITSPWLHLAFDPPWWKVALARLAARVWPEFTQDTEMVPARLSRDLDFLRTLPDPELTHNRMSARMYQMLTEGGARAAREAISLPYPALFIHGSHDPVTSVEATRQFFQLLLSKDKTLVIVPDAVHETHNDLCRESVLDQICAWVEGRL